MAETFDDKMQQVTNEAAKTAIVIPIPLPDCKNFAQQALNGLSCIDNLPAQLTEQASIAYTEITPTLPAENSLLYAQTQMLQRFPEDRSLTVLKVEFSENTEAGANALKDEAKRMNQNIEPPETNRHPASREPATTETHQCGLNNDSENCSLESYVRTAMQKELWTLGATLAQNAKPQDKTPKLLVEILNKLTELTVEQQNKQATIDASRKHGNHCNHCKIRKFPYKSHSEADCFRKANSTETKYKECHNCSKKGHTSNECWSLPINGTAARRPYYHAQCQYWNKQSQNTYERVENTASPNQNHHTEHTETNSGRNTANISPTHIYLALEQQQVDLNQNNYGDDNIVDVPHTKSAQQAKTESTKEKASKLPTAVTSPNKTCYNYWGAENMHSTREHPFLFLKQTATISDDTQLQSDHRTVVVTKMPQKYNQDAVYLCFSHYGEIERVTLYCPAYKNKNITAFILFKAIADSENLLTLSPLNIAGLTLNLEKPHSRRQRLKRDQVEQTVTKPMQNPHFCTPHKITNTEIVKKLASAPTQIQKSILQTDSQLFGSDDDDHDDRPITPIGQTQMQILANKCVGKIKVVAKPLESATALVIDSTLQNLILCHPLSTNDKACPENQPTDHDEKSSTFLHALPVTEQPITPPTQITANKHTEGSLSPEKHTKENLTSETQQEENLTQISDNACRNGADQKAKVTMTSDGCQEMKIAQHTKIVESKINIDNQNGYEHDKSTITESQFELQKSFQEQYGRRPGEIRNIIFVDSNETCEQVCEQLLHAQIKNKTIAIDCEFINGSVTYKQFPDQYRVYRPYDPNHKGPYARLMQISNSDGLVALFDLYKLSQPNDLQGGVNCSDSNLNVSSLPQSLISLLTNEQITRYGWASHSDNCSLSRTFGPKIQIGNCTDIQKVWINSKQTKQRTETTTNKLSVQPKSNSLASVIESTFGIKIDKTEQGYGYKWHGTGDQCSLTSTQLKYAANDAQWTMDLALQFFHISQDIESSNKLRLNKQNVNQTIVKQRNLMQQDKDQESACKSKRQVREPEIKGLASTTSNWQHQLESTSPTTTKPKFDDRGRSFLDGGRM